MSIYGYARISTAKQSIERQVRNITKEYPTAIIIKEAFTGTKIYERKAFTKLLAKLKQGDTLVFDSVSRMSRNATEGIKLYMQLFDKGITLVFLKEAYINTDVYASQLTDKIQMTGKIEDELFKGINNYFRALAAKQIEIAFDQAEKEVLDLHQRTKEGIETARLNGKQIGLTKGTKLTTQKSVKAKEIIKAHSKTFGGSLTDKECIELAKVTEKTFYKYKKEIKAELENQ